MACFFIATAWSDAGIAGHFRAVANGLVERGHTVIVLTDRQFVTAGEGVGNPALYGWPSPRPTHWRDFIFFLRLARRYQPDALIASFGASNVMTVGGWLARVPIRILWYHTLTSQLAADSRDPGWKTRLRMARKRQVYRLATHVVANSAAAQMDAERVYGIPPSKTAYFHYLLADPLAALSTTRADEPRSGVLCVGRLNVSKGQDVVIRALSLLKTDFPSAAVEFVGAGPDLQALVDLASELGVLDRCLFAGRMTREQVLARMRAARFTLAPSRWPSGRQ